MIDFQKIMADGGADRFAERREYSTQVCRLPGGNAEMTKGIVVQAMQVAVFSVLAGCAFDANPEPSFFDASDADGGAPGELPAIRPAARDLVDQQSAVRFGEAVFHEADAQEPFLPVEADGSIAPDGGAPKDSSVEPDAADVDAAEDAGRPPAPYSVPVCGECRPRSTDCAQGLLCSVTSVPDPPAQVVARCWPQPAVPGPAACAELCPGLPIPGVSPYSELLCHEVFAPGTNIPQVCLDLPPEEICAP